MAGVSDRPRRPGMIGQSSHFNSCGENVQYLRDRYNNGEVLRIFHVLDNWLRTHT